MKGYNQISAGMITKQEDQNSPYGFPNGSERSPSYESAGHLISTDKTTQNLNPLSLNHKQSSK